MKTLLALFLCLPAYSQSMVVNTTSGSATAYPTSQVESVTFLGENEDEGEQPSAKIRMKRSIVHLGHSIWRNDNYLVTYKNSGTFVTPFSGVFRGRGYQTLLGEVFSFPAVYSLGPDGGYSGYSLGATSATDSKSIAVEAQQAADWPEVRNAIWTIDFITNDFKRNIPLGTISDYRNATGPATFFGAVRQLYDKIRQLSGDDVIIVFANALKRNNSGYTSTSRNAAGCTLADYELAMLTCAAYNTNWYFVDQNRLSGITDENLSAVTADGLHLNNLGYTMAVRPWIDVLRTLADK